MSFLIFFDSLFNVAREFNTRLKIWDEYESKNKKFSNDIFAWFSSSNFDQVVYETIKHILFARAMTSANDNEVDFWANDHQFDELKNFILKLWFVARQKSTRENEITTRSFNFEAWKIVFNR